jgi:ABC-type hemin transport system ATPase subunit
MMVLQLDLSTHCIETELKRQYNKSVSAYFKAGRKEKRLLGQTIEILHQALQTLNFQQLRSQYPALSGGTKQEVILSRTNEELVIIIGNKKITT